MTLDLLAITPPSGAIDPDHVDAWLRGSAGMLRVAVLLREPGLSTIELLASPRLAPLRLRLAERSIPTLLSVSARELDVELLAAADPPIHGVQLRGDPSPELLAGARAQLSDRTPGLLLGRSCHGEPQPGDEHVDYTVLAPIFAPGTAQPGVDKRPIGLEGLRRWTVHAPPARHLIALGGITKDNLASVLEAGATGFVSRPQPMGIAGISLVFAGPRAAEDNVAALRRALAVTADRHVSPLGR